MPRSSLRLPSRVLVTGAAGGIGQALVRQLADGSVAVVGTDRCDRPHDTAANHWVRADLASADGRSGLVVAVGALQGPPLGGFVHVAGILDPADWEQIDEAQMAQVFAVNLAAPFFLTRALLPCMAPDASVVLIGSVSALRASPKTPFYSASKAALRNLAASMALALQPRGIRVNVVAPGLIDTPLTDGLNQQLALARGVPVATIETERAQPIPAGRAGTTDEVASCCLFLLSAESAYCNGMTMHPTGGVMAGVV